MTPAAASSFRPLGWLLAVLAIYAVALTLIERPLDIDEYRAMFSERGPFERLSPAFWLVLALSAFLTAWRLPRPTRWNLATLGCVAILMAMREADWHYKLVGGNVLKIKFYQHNPAALEVKIIAAVIVLAGIAVLLRALYLGFAHLRRRSAYSEAWTWTLLVGLAVGIGTKMLDRSISLAGEWFGVRFSEATGHLIGALEEGFECALPLIFMVAIVQFLLTQPGFLRASAEKRPGRVLDPAPPRPAIRSNS